MNPDRFIPKPHSGLIYLSGPMTGYVNDNFEAFFYVAAVLRRHGFTVLCPAEMGRAEGFEWADYLKRDIRMMMECTAVIVLPGHDQSRGARLESQLARDLQYPVWTLGYFLDMPENGFDGSGRHIVNRYLELAVLDPMRTL